MSLSKIMKVIVLLFFITSVQAQQRIGNIQGKVLTSDNTAAKYINVVIKTTTKGTITNAQGAYKLQNIPYGHYTLEFSLIGMKTKSIHIEVNKPEITVDNLILEENKEELNEVVIVAQRLNQFAQKKTPYVARLPLKNIHTPQSYTVVTNALINEQISIDLPTSLKSVTGGGYVEANTGAVSLYARGFRSESSVKNGLLLHPRSRTPMENQNIERVEVIKGASAVNYGAGFYGGVINLVTKQAQKNNKLDITYNTGSFNLHRITTDFNTAFGKHKQYRFRVNGAFHRENGFQSKGSEIRQNIFIAPTFTYAPSDKLSISLNTELYRGKRNLNFARSIGRNVSSDTWNTILWDFDNSYTSKDIAADMANALVQLNIQYKLASHWTSKTDFLYSNFRAEGAYLRLNSLSNTQIQREFIQFLPEKGGTINFRQDFIAEYRFSNISNKTLLGLSYYQGFWDFTRKSAQTGFFIPIDIIDLNSNTPVPNLTTQQLDAFTNVRTTTIESSNQTLAGYISNAITFNDQVTVLTGVRYDDFKNNATLTNGNEGKDKYNQGKVSYNLGVSIHPFGDNVALFGNYMNGFKNVGPGQNETGNTQNFAPEEVKQWETGFKFNLFDGKLKSTLSYYHINIDNAILRYRGTTGIYLAQDGKIESKGFEADLIANPFAGFNVVIGYTYNDAKNLKYSTPVAEGKQLVLNPQIVTNTWASYKFTRSRLKGLGFGIGSNHMSRIYAVGSVANTFWAQPYTTVDGTVFYQQEKFRIGVKLNNITDETYYNAYGIPQRKFHLIVGFTYHIF